jgi:hypothetical protein
MEEEEETGCVASGLRLNNFLNAVHRLEEEDTRTFVIFLQGQQQQLVKKNTFLLIREEKRYNLYGNTLEI